MKHLQGCNICLNSVMTVADKYKKSGFKPYYHGTRYTSTIDSKDVSCPNIFQRLIFHLTRLYNMMLATMAKTENTSYPLG